MVHNKMNSSISERQPKLNSTKGILDALHAGSEYPCFILAPRECGQKHLLKAYLAEFETTVKLSEYQVDNQGSCVLLQENDQCSQSGSVQDSAKENSSTAEEVVCISFVPWLEDEAAQRFSGEVDTFVQEGKRVLVFCSAQNDRYQDLQSDRVEVLASELKHNGFFTSSEYQTCFSQFIAEFLPLQVRLAAVLAVVLQQTNLEELQSLGYEFSSDIPQLLEDLCPLFTVTEGGEGICAESIGIEQIRSELFEVLGEYLAENGQVVTLSSLASSITALSIALLQKDDLEASHQVLGITEELISERVHHNRPSLSNRVPLSTENMPYGSMGISPNFPSHPECEKGTTILSDHDLGQGVSAMNRQGVSTLRKQRIPSLYLRLFGKLEVYIDGVPINNKFLSRSKIRRLLAYLAFNQHRAVSRDSLMDYLWPYLDFDRAQKNLYTSWCMLAKGLESEKVRECPYIQREGELYQLNTELVSCDIAQFEEIARTVLFGTTTMDVQTENVIQLEHLYHDSLVADIPVDSFISAKMEHYRSMMVDSLLLTTKQLRKKGEAEKALFCARTAYELDESREDVYRELMDTQLGAGQRTSAMQTYFSCKRYLSDELGILPSKSTTALYQDLLLDSCR